MKLHNRERVDGTTVTIGKRVYYNYSKKAISRKYTAEYRDIDGTQSVTHLGTNNRTQARRSAIEIQLRLDAGQEKVKPSNIEIEELVPQYLEIVQAKGIARTTVKKYRVDLDKLKAYCKKKKIRLARAFMENDLYLYRKYLVERGYADKTVQGAIVIAKQIFKWAWRQGLLQTYKLDAATFPKAKASPQACFTNLQVNLLIAKASGHDKLPLALMAYAGLRFGEVEQLQWKDVMEKDGRYTMLHIRRGGSNGTTKDRDERFVPIHPKIASLLAEYTRGDGLVLPALNQTSLLRHLKELCAEYEFENPKQYKLHSFRHYFASMCANHGVAHRKALAWLGHSNSDMLDLYYHLHDDDSMQTMMALAKSSLSEEVIQYPKLKAV